MNATLMIPPEIADRMQPDSEALYEVIDGQRRELPPMSAYETRIATLFTVRLEAFVQAQDLGRAVCEMLFELPSISRQRRPDVAFVSYKRWPKNRRVPSTSAWAVVPELTVEVVSRTETMVEVLAKVREYFQAGAVLVCLVLPAERQVYVYRSPVQIQVLQESEQLDGGDLLPGFQMPVAALFEGDAAGEETPEPPPAS